MAHFMDAESVQISLKIYNLTTTNAVLLKLTMILYLRKTFHLTNRIGCKKIGRQRAETKKPLRMSQKISFFKGIFQATVKTVIYMMHYLILHYQLKFCTNWTRFGEVILKKPIKIGPKWLLLAFWRSVKREIQREY